MSNKVLLDSGTLHDLGIVGNRGYDILESSGTQFVMTDYIYEELSDLAKTAYDSWALNRGDIISYEVEEFINLRVDTVETRQLGVAFKADGTIEQLGDASVRWLERELGFISDGSTKVLTNDGGLSDWANNLFPGESGGAYKTTLDLLNNALSAGDLLGHEYNTMTNDLSHRIQHHYPQKFRDLKLLETDLERVVDMVDAGVDAGKIDSVINNLYAAKSFGYAGDAFQLGLDVYDLNQLADAESDQAVEIWGRILGGHVGTEMTYAAAVATALIVFPEGITTAAGLVLLTGIIVLGGYAGQELGGELALYLKKKLHSKISNGQEITVEDVLKHYEAFVKADGQGQDGLDLKKLLEKVSAEPVEYCFPAGTLVRLGDGRDTVIEAVAIGDRVAAFATLAETSWQQNVQLDGSRSNACLIEESNFDLQPRIDLPLESAPVTRLIRNYNQKLIRINDLRVTDGHRLLRADGEFVEAGRIKTGDYLVDADGKPVLVESVGDVPGLHDTYNFTVASYHTYVAAGIRVHNDSLFEPQSEVGQTADKVLDIISKGIYKEDAYKDILIGSALRSFGSTVAEVLAGEEPSLNAEILMGRYSFNIIGGVGGYAGRQLFDALGEELGIPANLTGAAAVFGSQAGTELAQFTALTLISEILPAEHVLQKEAYDALHDDNGNPVYDPQVFLSSAAFSALGSFLGQELAAMVDNPELSAVVGASASAAVTQIGNNIIEINAARQAGQTTSTTLFSGVNLAVVNALGAVAGKWVASQIEAFDTYTEQQGVEIGSAVGAVIGQMVIPVPFVGAFVGAFIGGVLGGGIGGLFGNDPIGFADVGFDMDADRFYVSSVYGEDKNSEKIARDLAESATNTVHAVLDIINGDVVDSDFKKTTYGYEHHEFTYEVDGVKQNFGLNSVHLVNTGVMEALAGLSIAGGDIYVKRALAETVARVAKGPIPDGVAAYLSGQSLELDAVAGTTPFATHSREEFVPLDTAISFLFNNVAVARDYQSYLENQEVINAQIAVDPTSDFSVGWQLTLAQAFSLGLQRRNAVDWEGGWSWWLDHHQVAVEDVSVTYFGNERLFLLGEDGDAEFLGDSIAVGEKDLITGGDSSDVLTIDGDTFSRASSVTGNTAEFIAFNGFDTDQDITVGFSARLNGGGGHDLIHGGDLGSDMFGGEGNDKLVGGALDDWINAGAGDDVLIAGGGNGNVLSGDSGNDLLLGGDGDDWLRGGADHDVIRAGVGNDIIVGGQGNDQIEGGAGSDTFFYSLGDGTDHIGDNGKDGTDVLRFGEGILSTSLTLTASENGRDVIVTFGVENPGDTLILTGVLLEGTQGVDRFEFADGTSWSRAAILSQVGATISGVLVEGTTDPGLPADETLVGGLGNDTLNGGTGNDVLEGGIGSDVYQFNLGDGEETILDNGSHLDVDRVVFGAGISEQDLVFTRSVVDPSLLTISISGVTDTLTVKTRSEGLDNGVELFEFQDGTVLSILDINRLYLVANSSNGDNYVAGFDASESISTGNGSDTLHGGRGNDFLDGGSGDDTYHFNLGDGWDVISDFTGFDVLEFGEGINPNDIHLSLSPSASTNLLLTIPGTGDRLELIGQANDATSFKIEEIRFADGTVWTNTELQTRLFALKSTEGDDAVTGYGTDDLIQTAGGNDRIDSGSGDDTLIGGTGDDVLIGGTGDDRYEYSLGDGRDVFIDSSSQSSSDTLVFGAGITVGSITVEQDLSHGRDLRITFEDGDWVELRDMDYTSGSGIEFVSFADGTTLSREQLFDLARANWGSAGKDDIIGFSSAETLNAGAGDDRILAGEGDDTLIGGTGNDVLSGGAGDDRFEYELGDGQDIIIDTNVHSTGDTLVLGAGIDLASITVEQDLSYGRDIRITFADGGWVKLLDTDRPSSNGGIDLVSFSDGTTLTREQLFDRARSDWGSANDDDIFGFSSADFIDAGAGDDRISSGEGDDTLIGGNGEDTLTGGSGDDRYEYSLGDGRDVLIEDNGHSTNDRLVLAAGIAPADVTVSYHPEDQDSVYLTFSDGGWILLKNQLNASNVGIEAIEFSDGTTWTSADLDTAASSLTTINGTNGDEALVGTGLSEVIIAGNGNDTITGGAGDDFGDGGDGDDTYVFNLGDGRDVFYGGVTFGSNGSRSISAGTDTLAFGSGIAPSDIVVFRDDVGDGGFILRITGTNDEVSIYTVDQVTFEDGTVWTYEEIAQRYIDQNSTLGDDHINGLEVGEIINTGAGNDRIYAKSGDDTINGGTGNDYANGGQGNDTYVFNLGDGRDVFDGGSNYGLGLNLREDTNGYVSNSSTSSRTVYSGTDTLAFGAGIAEANILVRRDENENGNFVLKIVGTDDEISIYSVEQVTFSDGAIWTYEDIAQKYVDQNSTAGDDYINGYNVNEAINSGEGNDRIYADSGNDTINGGAGDDYANGGQGDDTYVFNLGDGRDVFDGGSSSGMGLNLRDGTNDYLLDASGNSQGRTIYSGTDTLTFGEGIDPDDIIVSWDESNDRSLILQIAGTNDQVTIYSVEQVTFFDGTVWEIDDINQRYAEQNSTTGGDVVNNASTGKVIDTGAGNDQVNHYSNNEGGTYQGGTGDDYFIGSAGNDVFVFNIGDGTDVVADGYYGSDVLAFGDGISLSDLTITEAPSPYNLLTTIEINGTGDRVLVRNIEILRFADGTEVEFSSLDKNSLLSGSDPLVVAGDGTDNTVIATAQDDTLVGHRGQDSLLGGAGSDTYKYAVLDGADIIRETADAIASDMLVFAEGINPEDVLVLISPTDATSLILRIGDGNDEILLEGQLLLDGSGIEVVQFANGETWNRADISDYATQIREVAADLVVGTGSDDIFSASAGNHRIIGGAGDDTYLFNLGDGEDIFEEVGGENATDKIEFGAGITGASLKFFRSSDAPDDLKIIVNSTDSIVLKNQFTGAFSGINQILFSDGSTLDRADFQDRVISDFGDGDDTIIGFDSAETLTGGLGNDLLDGANGGDTYQFDTLDGHDVILDNGSDGATDTLVLGPGIAEADVRVERDLAGAYILKTTLNDWSVKLDFRPDQAPGGIEVIQFFDGTTWSPEDLLQRFHETASQTVDGTVFGNADDETLVGGIGNDTLYGEGGSDSLSGAAGHDILIGGIGDDTLSGEAGNDTLQGGLGTDSFDGGEGSDTADFFYSSADWSIDLVSGTANVQTNSETLTSIENIVGGSGNDSITGDDNANSLAGGSGDDLLIGGLGDDTLIGGEGNDDLQGSGGIDTADFSSSSDNWTIDLQNGSATIQGETDTLSGIENVLAGSGDDALTGDVSDNQLYGGLGSDTIYGGAGNDTLVGGEGSDFYQFGLGAGQDTVIAEREDGDILEMLSGVNPADVILTKSGSDLIVSIQGATDLLTVNDQFGVDITDWTINEIRFDDGTIWGVPAMLARLTQGTDGDDLLEGFETADILNGGLGNDTLQGNGGIDTYQFGLGSGQDTVIAEQGGGDIIQLLSGIVPGNVTLSRNGSDLVLSIDGTLDTITVSNQFGADTSSWGINEIHFEDGTIWDGAAIRTELHLGTSGNDTLEGFETNDTLNGGLGNDVLIGNAGTDTYQFDLGFGQDVVESADGASDIVEFLSGITPEDLILVQSGDDLVISISGAPDTLTITRHFEIGNGDWGVGLIQFSDGTDWDVDEVQAIVDGDGTLAGVVAVSEVITGTSAADTLVGGLGNDTLHGADGADIYEFTAGDGQDVIEENGYYDTDVLKIHGYTPDQVTVAGIDNHTDLVLTFAGSTDQITILNTLYNNKNDTLEEIHFDDGTIWTMADVKATIVANYATDGDDVIDGFGSAADTLVGGLGNDTLHGADGADIYEFTAGDGQDVIEENGYYDTDVLKIRGYTPDQVTVAGIDNHTDLVLTFAGSTDQITILNTLYNNKNDTLEEIHFDDGTIWTMADVKATIVANYATDGDDVIDGFGSAADTLVGGLGNDTLHGADGADIYEFTAGDGQDVIEENGNHDTDVLKIHGYTPDQVTLHTVPASAADLNISFSGSTDSIKIINTLNNSSSDTLEEIHFDDGTIWTQADISTLVTIDTSGDDTLNGTSSADTLDGGLGNDSISGGNGDDALYGGGGNDTLRGNDGADSYFGGDGDDLMIASYGEESFDGGAGIDTVDISYSGANWTINLTTGLATAETTVETLTGVENIIGSRSSDTITGDTVDNVLEGYNGSDVINGEGGNDSLIGGAGNDTLNGGDGNDTLSGNDGTDQYSGGDGDDLMIAGFGEEDFDGGTGIDTVDFSYSGANWTINLTTGLATADTTVETVTAVENINGSQGNDLITGDLLGNSLEGDAGADTLIGGAGNDTLSGGDGADTYQFASGDGQDVINDTAVDGASDTLQLTSGIDHDQLWFEQTGDDLLISVIGTSDQITVENWYASTDNKVENIETSDGQVADIFGVEALVTAMASFSPPGGGATDLSDPAYDPLDSVLAANWQSSV